MASKNQTSLPRVAYIGKKWIDLQTGKETLPRRKRSNGKKTKG